MSAFGFVDPIKSFAERRREMKIMKPLEAVG